MTTILSIQSSVAYGHVGNSAATFPLMRSGIEVWPVLTVHFSNNTSYPGKKGPLLRPEDVHDVVEGIDDLGVLNRVDAVLTGYQGAPAMGAEILRVVELVKQRIEVTDGKLQAAFVVSRAIKGTRIGGEVADALAGYALPILDARITQRVSYPGTAAAGTTVLESEPDGDAAAEVRALAAEIKQKLN